MAINQIDWIKTSDNKEYETRGFYFIEGTGTTAGTWLGSHIGIKEYYDGLTIAYKIPVAGARTTTLNINNLGAKTVYRNASSKITTHYPVNTVVILTYISTGSYPGWHRADYDTTDTYSLRPYYTLYYTAKDLYRYKICGVNKYGRLEPLTLTNQTSNTIVDKAVNTTPIRPNEFYYYNNTITIAANKVAGHGNLYLSTTATTLHYTINSTGTTYKEIYLVGTYDKTTGLFTLDSTNSTSWYVLVPYNEDYNLTDYFDASKNYVLLGRTYSSNNYFYLFPNHTTYKFDGQSLIEISTCTETKQKYSTENTYKPLLMSDEFTNADSSGEIVGDVAWNNKIYANPSTGYVHASGVKSNGDVLNIESNNELQLRGPSYLVAYSNFVDIFTDGESNKIRIDSNDLRINASRNNASTVIGYEGTSGATGNIKLNATTVEILAGQNTYTIDNDGITATGHTELGNEASPFDHYINSIKAKTASSGTTYGQGSAGQVLTSNGSQVYWSTPSSITDGYWANIKVSDTSSTTTSPTFANINAYSDSAIHKIATGTNASSYFQSRKFRGEGEADSYYHGIDFGYSGHNQVDFYEYGGLWNFWKNTTSTATTSEGNLALQIGLNGLKNKSYTYTWPNKTGTFALTSDIPTKTSQLTNDSNFVAAEDGKIPSSYLPAYVDDVLEYNNKSAFPTTGESGVIYIDKATNLTYRWSGTAYVEISPSIALGETASTAYPGNKGKANADAITNIQGTLNGLDNRFAAKTHTHTVSDITNFPAINDGKLTINVGGTSTTFTANQSANTTLNLAKVASSGSYNDLTNKPTGLPASGGNADTVDNLHLNDQAMAYKYALSTSIGVGQACLAGSMTEAEIFALTGNLYGKYYYATDTNKIYRRNKTGTAAGSDKWRNDTTAYNNSLTLSQQLADEPYIIVKLDTKTPYYGALPKFFVSCGYDNISGSSSLTSFCRDSNQWYMQTCSYNGNNLDSVMQKDSNTNIYYFRFKRYASTYGGAAQYQVDINIMTNFGTGSPTLEFVGKNHADYAAVSSGGSLYSRWVSVPTGGIKSTKKWIGDADKLDGQDGSYYLNYNNLNNKPKINDGKLTITIDGTKTEFTANQSTNTTLTLAKVASTGSYNDLTNKPTIPDISDFVSGPSTSEDNAIVRWDGTTGKIVQDSKVVIDDSGNITIGGTWTDTSANNPGLSMGGYAKLTANTAGAFTLSPSNTATYLATATEFRPISSKDSAIDLGSSTYYWRNVYANKFIKKDSSDEYVLLGAGGHKAISSFAGSNHNHDDVYLKAESDTLQSVTTRGASTNKAITVQGFTTSGAAVNITGTGNYSEGIRIHPHNELSSLWFNATADAGYCTNGMWGITAYTYGYSDSNKKNMMYFRGPTASADTTPTNQMWISGSGLVTSRGGFAKSGKNDTEVLLAGGGTKPISEFGTKPNNGTLTIQKNGTQVAVFTADSSTDVTANITVPTNVSDLEGANNFATKSDLDKYLPLTGGTLTGDLTLKQKLIFTDTTNPFIQMTSGGNTYYFQAASGQFGLGPTWTKATRWDANGNITSAGNITTSSGTITAQTLAGNLDWSYIQNKPNIPTSYSLPLAANGTRGGIQIGYSESGANIPLKLSSEKGYVTLTRNAMHTAGFGEAYLSWGGRNISGNYAPIDAALNPYLGPNRLAGMKAAGITVEYSNDGGSTWTDYGASNTVKTSLVTTSATLRIAGPSANANANSKLRITLDGIDGQVYTQLWKFHIYISTNHSQGCKVSIESYDYNKSTEWHSVVTDQPISGWSGWNVINASLPGSGAFGGNNNAIHQRKIRFTFTHTGVTSGNETKGLQVLRLYAYGGVGWTTPSTLAATGTPYTYAYDGSTTFMSSVAATSFTEGGQALSNKYAPKTHSHASTDITNFSGILINRVSSLPTASATSADFVEVGSVLYRKQSTGSSSYAYTPVNTQVVRLL